MKGHPILLSDASITAFWVWLKAKYGFTDDQVRKYTFGAAPFLADKRVVQQGYATSEPYLIEKEGKITPKVFLLADDGYPAYASFALVPDGPDRQEPGGGEGLRRGHGGGLDSPTSTAMPSPGDALILKDNPEMTQDVLDQAREKMRSYGIVRRQGVGQMDRRPLGRVLPGGVRAGRLSQGHGLQERLHAGVPAQVASGPQTRHGRSPSSWFRRQRDHPARLPPCSWRRRWSSPRSGEAAPAQPGHDLGRLRLQLGRPAGRGPASSWRGGARDRPIACLVGGRGRSIPDAARARPRRPVAERRRDRRPGSGRRAAASPRPCGCWRGWSRRRAGP